jgi:very-short-patch-repair endonuclease
MRAGGEGRKPLLERVRSLRSNQTEDEQRLWYYLRARRFSGLKFKRQKPVWLRNEGFIVLRFWNNQVLGDTEAVLGSIRETPVSLNVTT